MSEQAKSSIKIIYLENGKPVNRVEIEVTKNLETYMIKQLNDFFEIEMILGTITKKEETTLIVFSSLEEKLKLLEKAFRSMYRVRVFPESPNLN